ncbi:LL-diaminopimelate aminotransferase [Siminovitchia fordii]|uniref:LL-diaminopimelate aminotransferase n=1 Tax=Siminovitchia fordii TaxID=254759 RepID=A0ABQ4K451_9BACI|nr:LL-diaminopimelate aminotransferase [Siminovitchia fordii]GIN20517.1 LL-diaminopimelate aminotransferase [Siminovitchia fordii]
MRYRSNRVSSIPPYAFLEMKKNKEKLIEQNVDVIDLGMGDPDLPTHPHIVEKLMEELQDSNNLKYPNPIGCIEYRKAVAHFYKKQYDVDLNPETEVIALIGSKEGTANLIPALIDPGETVLIPDPAYPVYEMATILANGRCYKMPLEEKNNYEPEFSSIPDHVVKEARLMFLNYPNNPTTACVDVDFFQQACDFAKKNNLIVANDSAYNMVSYGEYKPPSILQANSAKEVAIEFGTLSKTFNMTGFRIGYMVGNAEVIKSLSILKGNIDTGQFTPIQKAAAYALQGDYRCIEEYNGIYESRLNAVVEALRSIGVDIEVPKAAYFVWARVPEGYTSAEFAQFVLEKTGVMVTPGTAFGEKGEGYFRIAVSVDSHRIQEAVTRIKNKIFL